MRPEAREAPEVVVLSPDGDVITETGEPLSSVPEVLRPLAAPMTPAQVKRIAQGNLEAAQIEKKGVVTEIRSIVSDTQRIRAGLIRINKKQLEKDRNDAMAALRWVVGQRDTELAREIVVAAKEILNEARERDAIHAAVTESKREKESRMKASLPSEMHERLIRAVEGK